MAPAVALAILAASPSLAQFAPDKASRPVPGGTQQQALVGGAGLPPAVRGKATRDVPMGTYPNSNSHGSGARSPGNSGGQQQQEPSAKKE
jgi:hypothetical protein